MLIFEGIIKVHQFKRTEKLMTPIITLYIGQRYQRLNELLSTKGMSLKLYIKKETSIKMG